MSNQQMGPPPLPAGSGKTSGLAIASLVLALLVFIPGAAVVAIILGIIALSKISSSSGRLRGQGLAIAGLCIGGIWLVMGCMILPAMLLPALSRARSEARAAACRANLKQLGLSISLYQMDYPNDMPPDLATLCAKGYLMIGINEGDIGRAILLHDTVLTCPECGGPVSSADVDGTSSYYYARVEAPQELHFPGQVPIAWDKRICHPRGVNVLYADGHVDYTPVEVLRQRLDEYSGVYEKPAQMPLAAER
jgi:prepilin-type processing-associated H-X9-DG protein